jgi:TldD protein
MRAEGWNRIPLIRMTNISILPGEKPLSFDQLLASTDDGIFMETNRSWSIDDKRYNFQFGCEIGWEIKGGKLGRMLKNPSYSGITTEFWNSMDAICSRDEWTLWGTPNCGKGQPMQTMGTGHGAAPARFRNVKIGTAYKGN